LLLKQQFFSASGAINGREHAFRRHHPTLQFLPLMLAEWVAKNMANELDLPDFSDDFSSADMNHILTGLEQKGR
jgi:hypothetical protein